ncbi:radical SAM/SPASM domain-containing protein [Selenomonas ruminantium]|uniref:Radical SAM superfamily enzyme, MoaA/NifB/PqqE/SkfB family n=1 Tax=Selenomonas ruminantium TaxID=971 RepID=A0A1H0S2J8_SELRU|nr:radical SAM/SPASM domain-containing protein [Selenomonas ruminantium]SDP35867.1 Radical SAM superfamily enzyme, MoaA/NifB/PqqE/SkfB family [Selenomonas ruminantium]
MHICERALNYLQITDYQGTVRMCSWIRKEVGDGIIGKLQEKSLYEIWHGEKAEKLREKLSQGDYSWCNIDQCPYLSRNEIEEHCIDIEEIPEYPEHIWLAFDRNCNYACTCCTASFGSCNVHRQGEFEGYQLITEKLKEVMPHLKFIAANGLGELFVSPHILKLLSNWKPLAPKEDITVLLETNGSLFDENHWKQIENLGQYNLRVSITVMSFDEATYQFCSGTKLPISQIENNLRFVKGLREQGVINYLELATVVQERNFRTMPEFTRRCIEEFGADVVRLRPFDDCGAQPPEVEWFMDVRGAYHPYHQEYLEVMKNPIFKHPKVADWSGGRNSENGDLITYLAERGCGLGAREISEMFSKDHDIASKLKKFFEQQNIRRLAIHGVGMVGVMFLDALAGTGIEVDRLIDKNRASAVEQGITITKVEELPTDYQYTIVICSLTNYGEIEREISGQVTAPRILSIKEVLSELRKSKPY